MKQASKTTRFLWDKKAIEKLEKLIFDGISAKEIAKKFNLTKSAILGKAWRMGLGIPVDPKQKIHRKVSKKPRTIYKICYENEEIKRGTCKSELVIEVREILNFENPPGEKRWTSKEVKMMLDEVT